MTRFPTHFLNLSVCSDLQLKEIIKAINDVEQPSDRFIISDLKGNGLFIKTDRVEFVQKKVKEYSNKLRYETKD